MKTIVQLIVVLLVAIPAAGAERATDSERRDTPVPVVYGEGVILTSSSSSDSDWPDNCSSSAKLPIHS